MTREHCIRCGECCRSGGPALHEEDLALIREGVISASDLITLRAGEPVFDQPSGGLAVLKAEMVKLRGRGGDWACLYFEPDGAGCAIYEHRPAECRALKCWDTSDLAAMYERGRITRARILGPGAMDIVAGHEARCPVSRAVNLAVSGAGMELSAMYDYDTALRETLTERGASPHELDFLLGRPLRRVVERILAARRG